MKKTAFDHVTIDIEYERPHFDFPDLRSEQGNPYFYFRDLESTLRKNGFSLEARELASFKFEPYEESFNKIALYLDISPTNNITGEDEEYVYIKVKKNQKSLQQISWFNISNLEEIKQMVSDGHDFSEENIYGRTFFHYISNPEILEYMLEENKKHNWISLLHFDNLECHLLSMQSNIKNYSIVLKHTQEAHPQLAEKILFVNNKLNRKPVDYFLNMFHKDILPNFNSENTYIQPTKEIFAILEKIDSSISTEFADLLKNSQEYKSMPSNKKTETLALFLDMVCIEQVSKPKAKSKI